MKHPTDDEIQSYLQEGRSDWLDHVEDHLRICSNCRKRLLLYEKLGCMVVSTVSNRIPIGFERAVMKRLKSVQRQRRITDLIVAAVALSGILAVGTLILLTPQLRQVAAGYLIDVWHYAIQLASENGGTTEPFAIPIIGILFLALFAVIDRPVAANLKTARQARI